MILLQVSIYPIGDCKIDETLNIFWDNLKRKKINFKITPLSTIIWSEEEMTQKISQNNIKKNLHLIEKDHEQVLLSVYRSYRKAKQSSKAVMVITTTEGKEEDVKKLLNFL